MRIECKIYADKEKEGRMMKKQMKRNQGITLITLVITIIVLLILAAISISVLTGEDGIINNAKKSKEDTEIAEEKEILNVSISQAVGEDVYGNLEEDNFREKLNDNAEGTELEKIGDNYKVTFPSEREYIVTGDGEINKIDKENTVELVAKLAYRSYTGEYYIGVGFADYQLYYDVVKNFINFLQEKTEKEKEELFIEIANEYEKTNFTTIEDIFKYFYEMEYTGRRVTSLEELAEEWRYDSVEELLLEQMLHSGYKYDEYLAEFSGTLIAPNGEQYRISIEELYKQELGYGEVFESYCYKYPINQNGEYTFIFIGDDGSYGETTLKIDNETPHIVTAYGLDSSIMALMLGIDNFIDMEEVSIEIVLPSNETINLTPYISNDIGAFPDAVKGIDIYSVPELRDKNLEGEVTCLYNGIELKRKGSIYKGDE